jgi:hypothetical protein
VNLAGVTTLIIRRLIIPLTVTLAIFQVSEGSTQGTFPAPLPGQATMNNAWPFSPANGVAPVPHVDASRGLFPVTGAAPLSAAIPERCTKEFVPLREDIERNGKLMKAAGERHAPREEACKLIGNYGHAEIRLIEYVESRDAACRIPPQIANLLKESHKNTESMRIRVCAVAQQLRKRVPAGPTGDFYPASARDRPISPGD